MAQLILLIDQIKAGDKAGALARANALPSDGVHRYVGPLALAWTRMAMGDLAGADAALQGLDKFNGFAPLKYFQLGLLYDFAGQAGEGRGEFQRDLEATGQLNWRLTDAMANFYRAARPPRQGGRDLSAVHQGEFRQRAGRIGAGRPARRPRRR